jgi:hypothetical protein
VREYALTCDVCRLTLAPDDGVVSWITQGEREQDHRLTHAACRPADATDVVELRLLTSPSGFLGFVTERFGRRIAQPDAVAGIVWALAPFIARHDTGVEMNVMRAATFGTVFGVKPGEIRRRHRAASPIEGTGTTS